MSRHFGWGSLRWCGLLAAALVASGCQEEPTEPESSFQAARGKTRGVTITVDRDTLNALGDTAQLTANIPLQWISLTPAIARVDSIGRVFSMAVGSALIRGYAGRKADTVKVFIRQVPAEVRVTPTTLALLTGDHANLSATVADSNGRPAPGAAITWSSSAPAVAGVDPNGRVTAISAGTATLSAGSGPARAGTVAVTIQRRGPWKLVTAGLNHTCGLTADGAAYCWGEGVVGQLGADQNAPRSRPQPVVGGLLFTTLSAGDSHTCGITSSGDAYCWGYNYIGQLGNGSVENSFVPTRVAGGLAMAAISAGSLHTCAITTSGQAYCWGSDLEGILGTGQPGPDSCAFSRCALTPQAVAGGFTFTAIAAGFTESCGVITSGEAYCWGSNTYGQLGDATRLTRTVPTPVYGGTLFASLTIGWRHACGRTPTGGTFCWGRNNFGQVAAPNGLLEQLTPTAILSFAGAVTTLSAGFIHSCRTVETGATECWGDNTYGQLGDGTTTRAYSPVPSAAGLSLQQIASGGNHTCGMTRTNELYCWGYNVAGQLGNGTKIGPELRPVPVLDPMP
jgi:alpha-tubulin suppressor-like RCC1 family protein